jgi:hypothetical protein
MLGDALSGDARVARWRTIAPMWVFALASTTAHAVTPLDAADVFYAGLRSLCGQAYEGRIVENTPADPADPFAGQRLVMHVRECSAQVLRIPFHVGDDRSRTWVVTRTATGLQLQHDHRHADGSADAMTNYGGVTDSAGTAARQDFPADAYSKALFLREGRAVSVDNTWALELVPGEQFVYELTRPGRRFRVAFDLTRSVPPPPAPWGAH